MNDNQHQNQSAHIHRLTRTLLISGAFNVLLLAFLFYFLARETLPRPYFELKPAKQEEQLSPLALDSSNKKMIKDLRALSMEQLIAKLTDTQLIENGYTERDLALSALIAFYNFDLSRALSGNFPAQQRKISFGKTAKGVPVEVIVYPGMREEQYQAIVQFAKTEKWPLTSRGLFLQLRKEVHAPNPSLVDAFLLTPEFIAVETLFNRADVRVTRPELLNLIQEGNWKSLSTFYEQQKTINDLSPARRQQFLLNYIDHHSKAAAQLLLKTDGVFAVSKLDDAHIIAMLNLLTEKTPLSEKFSLILLTSPRGDAVRHAAALKLYDFAGEAAPEKDIHNAALTRFIPKPNVMKARKVDATAKNQKKQALPKSSVIEKPLAKTKPITVPTKGVVASAKPPAKVKPIATTSKEAPKKSRSYVVQEGDSLWKISRKFKVDMGVLKKLNKLESDFLKPGTTLRLPDN